MSRIARGNVGFLIPGVARLLIGWYQVDIGAWFVANMRLLDLSDAVETNKFYNQADISFVPPPRPNVRIDHKKLRAG